jgi:hypothetical protein
VNLAMRVSPFNLRNCGLLKDGHLRHIVSRVSVMSEHRDGEQNKDNNGRADWVVLQTSPPKTSQLRVMSRFPVLEPNQS